MASKGLPTLLKDSPPTSLLERSVVLFLCFRARGPAPPSQDQARAFPGQVPSVATLAGLEGGPYDL